MTMAAELIPRINVLDERQTMLISQIVMSAERATGILDQLLDITRARLGSGLRILRGQMDMSFVTRQLVDEMRTMHPRRTFNVDISGNTEGEWDKPRVGQVLSNLLGNAVQYGFIDLPIVLTIKGNAKDVTLSVHNEGVPIPKGSIGGYSIP
jgi:signal transduction histidine kinase